MKNCSACGKLKPASDFQKRAASHDGRTSACAECLRKRDRARYPAERERRSLQSRAYVSGKGRVIAEAAKKRWRERNKLARAAHVIVGNAVRDGRLKKQPCQECGKRAEAHHEDYLQPLDVIWLCPRHHKALHASKGK